MRKIAAFLMLAFIATAGLSGCAWMNAHNPYKWACDKVNGKFDPATGDCDKNLFK